MSDGQGNSGVPLDAGLFVGVRWDDLRFPFTRDRQGVAAKPDYDFIRLGLLFPNDGPDEIVYVTDQFTHSWKEGSYIVPHIHWAQEEVATPTWKIDFRWYGNGQDPFVVFTTYTATFEVFTYPGSGDILQISVFPNIFPPSVLGVSSFFDLKIYRDDTDVAGDVLGKGFDFHIQMDTTGSRTEFSK